LNKYKRIFHHIDFKEAKGKHLEDLAVKKLEEERKVKQEKEISKLVEEKKYSWRDTLTESEWVALDTGGIANKTTQTFGLTDFGMPVMGPDFSQVTANFGGLGGVDVHPSEVGYNGMEGEPQTTPPPTYNQLALAGFTKPLPMFRRQGEANAKEINSRLDASQGFAQATGADAYMNARLEDEKKKHDLKMKEWATDALQALKDIQGNQELKVEDVVQTDRWELQKLVSDHNQSLYRKIDALENKLLHNYQKRQALLGYGTKDYGQYSVGGYVDQETAEFVGTHVNVNKPPYPGYRFANPVKDVGRTQKYLKLQAEDAAANKEIIELKKQFKDDPPKFDPFIPNNIGPPNVVDPNLLTKIPGASTAVVFDYYLDWLNKTKGGNSTVQDLSNLMSEEDKDWLRDFLDYIKSTKGKITFADGVFQDRTKKDDDQDFGVGDSKADDDNGGIPFGIRNIIGDIDLGRGEGFSEDADYYYVNKKYDFENWKDTVAPGVGYLSTYYAWGKGLGKWMGKGEHGTPTMHMVIRIPKKKKKKKKK
tara:strand:+ start:1542 stop:3146 length:1605 start_codon:yes stop_codon:yes gene_type:complete